jgi:hypothetical protein
MLATWSYKWVAGPTHIWRKLACELLEFLQFLADIDLLLSV